MNELNQVLRALKKASSPEKAKTSKRFFKTAKGDYGEGDKFWGITVPQQRKIARQFIDLNYTSLESLISSPVHEHRFTALEILVFKYEQGDQTTKDNVFKFYVKNKTHINNWDLVDTSVEYIVGEHLHNADKSLLYKWATSKNIWQRRMAIVATFNYIKKNEFTDTLKISKILLKDDHDLIHKAVGWMLRETGKRSAGVLQKFLQDYYRQMPRTMLRYAIERFPEKERQAYLKGLI